MVRSCYPLFCKSDSSSRVTSLNAILISRFILDLRSIDNELSQNTSFSSIRFMGNIGAPVSDRSVWTTSAADDIDNVQDERREENSTERVRYTIMKVPRVTVVELTKDPG